MPEGLHDFVFFDKNFDRASGTLVPFLSEAQVSEENTSMQWNKVIDLS